MRNFDNLGDLSQQDQNPEFIVPKTDLFDAVAKKIRKILEELRGDKQDDLFLAGFGMDLYNLESWKSMISSGQKSILPDTYPANPYAQTHGHLPFMKFNLATTRIERIAERATVRLVDKLGVIFPPGFSSVGDLVVDNLERNALIRTRKIKADPVEGWTFSTNVEGVVFDVSHVIANVSVPRLGFYLK